MRDACRWAIFAGRSVSWTQTPSIKWLWPSEDGLTVAEVGRLLGNATVCWRWELDRARKPTRTAFFAATRNSDTLLMEFSAVLSRDENASGAWTPVAMGVHIHLRWLALQVHRISYIACYQKREYWVQSYIHNLACKKSWAFGYSHKTTRITTAMYMTNLVINVIEKSTCAILSKLFPTVAILRNAARW